MANRCSTPSRLSTITSLVVRRLLSSDVMSTSFSSMNRRTVLAADEPLSMTVRRSASAPARVVENRLRSRVKLRIELARSTWEVSTVLLDRMRAVVRSKLASAVSMNEVVVSMI